MTTNASRIDELILLLTGTIQVAAEGIQTHEPVKALEAASWINRLSEALVDRLAEEAREEGASWTQIGKASNRSRQAAQQRWGAARDEQGPQTETLDLEEPATEQPATEQPATEQPATPKVHTIVRAPGEKGGPDGVIGSAERWWLFCYTCGAVPETTRTREEARAGRRAHLRDVHGQEVEK